jgi:hypothetical protein
VKFSEDVSTLIVKRSASAQKDKLHNGRPAKSPRKAARYHPYHHPEGSISSNATASHHKPRTSVPANSGPFFHHATPAPQQTCQPNASNPPSNSMLVAAVRVQGPLVFRSPVPGPLPSSATNNQELYKALWMRQHRFVSQQLRRSSIIGAMVRGVIVGPSNNESRRGTLASRNREWTYGGWCPIPVFVDDSGQQRCPVAILQSDRVLCVRCRKGCIGEEGFNQHLKEDINCRIWYQLCHARRWQV